MPFNPAARTAPPLSPFVSRVLNTFLPRGLCRRSRGGWRSQTGPGPASPLPKGRSPGPARPPPPPGPGRLPGAPHFLMWPVRVPRGSSPCRRSYKSCCFPWPLSRDRLPGLGSAAGSFITPAVGTRLSRRVFAAATAKVRARPPNWEGLARGGAQVSRAAA